jgi:hypothetical protein
LTGLTRTLKRLRKPPPAPVSAADIMKLANELIRTLGERSTSYANYQALKAQDRGDGLHQKVWRWIAGATVEILRSDVGEVSGETSSQPGSPPGSPMVRHSVSPGS